MCRKQMNIITSWLIFGLGTIIYFVSMNIYVSFFIYFISIPMRKNLYSDESLYAVINEFQSLSFIAALISLILSGSIVYKIFSHSDKLYYEVVNRNECLLVFLPIIFLYLFRDIKLFSQLKK